MKTRIYPTFFFSLFLVATSFELSAQISGQVINFTFNRYNSATNGAKVTVHDGENLGTMFWRGWTPGNEYQASAGFGVDVTGVPMAGYLPSRLSFYTGGSGPLERMTILENGRVGIGLSNPAELVDINGNVIVRGTRLSLGLGSAFGNGGEALTHSNTDCAGAPLPDEVLTINNDGGFAGGVYVEGPGGLHVCATLDADCLQAENNVVSESGNVVALGGAAIAVPCAPGQGDFIAEGNNGDFIARHGNFVAEQGNMTAQMNITSVAGNIAATAGNVSAGIDVSATNNLSAGANLTVGGTATVTSNAVIGGDANITGDVNAASDANIAGNANVTGNAIVTGNVRVGTLTGTPTGHEVAVGGSIICEEVVVKLQTNWPDYVFEKDAPKPDIKEWEAFIAEHKHLPGMPSAEEMSKKDGLALGEMQRLMVEKIEQLTLIIIEQQKQIDALKAISNQQKN